MYNVLMARYSASDARRQFSGLLDAAERGEEVVLERHGVRFRLTLDPSTPEPASSSPLIIEDEDVLSGNWTWATDEQGRLKFSARDE